MNAQITVEPGLKPVRIYENGELINKKAKRSVLIQNKANSYKFVPEDLANDMVKNHEAIILKPSDPDYLDGTKKALGHWEGVKSHETVQVHGKFIKSEELGKLDIERIEREAEQAIKEYKPGEDGNKPLPTIDTFEGKKRQRRF